VPPIPTRYLVTGGAGFVGSHIVDALVERGDEVRVLDDLSTGNLGNLAQSIGRIEFIKGSILDDALTAEAAGGCTGIFHLAAVVSVQESIECPIPVHQTNSLGTLIVLEAARRANASVVFSSSAAVYGDDPQLPKREDMQTAPISPYGIQKLAGEHYVRTYSLLHGIGGCSLRYFNIYGPRQNPSSPYSGVISKFVDAALAGEPLTIFGDGKQTRDFVFVGDVVQANLSAMDSANARGLSLNVGTGIETNLIRLANEIVAAAGSSSQIRHSEAKAGDILRSVSDPSATERILGFKAAVSLEHGLGMTVESLSR
jgi:UDP-glucose 4-epimerase